MAKTTVALQKVSVNSPQAMAKFATVLKTFIIDRKLHSNIKGKNYVNVEGWEFAGASMGITAVVTETINLTTEKEVKYQATVELRVMSTSKVVGTGVAVCSNQESAKKQFDEYAILSMAQTRAIGKAYRNTFGWLMKMAGYEPTPAEEMDDSPTFAPEPQEAAVSRQEMHDAVDQFLVAAPTHERLKLLKTAKRMNDKQLTDKEYTTMYFNLPKDQQ